MSARPDLCGGHRATSVPTAIDNHAWPPYLQPRPLRFVNGRDAVWGIARAYLQS